MNKLNPSINHHLIIGVFISIWIFLFAYFIRPFDNGTLNFNWTKTSISFSIIAFISYSLITIFQSLIYKKNLKWNFGFELLVLFLFHVVYLIISYIYYKSPIHNGIYNFFEFLNFIILKSALITTPILFLARIYLIKFIPIKHDKITIKGKNRLDILNINKSDLICVTNSQNYVEIFFLRNDQLTSKLIRSSLKVVQENLDFLIQVHRSHLINPMHFQSWKNRNTIYLTQMEISVSKKYKDNILNHKIHT